MNFGQNLKAFLKKLPLRKMSGHQKFLAAAAIQCKGSQSTELGVREIRRQWRKSLLGVKYNPAFYDRAQQAGWVNPSTSKKGSFFVTKEGLDNLTALAIPEGDFSEGELQKSGSLIIVNRKGTHSFDKFLRKLLAEAKNQVFIADSHVDGTIFDRVLDVIPKTAMIRLIYGRKYNNFDQRAKRFSKEYQKFSVRKYKWLHDRFMVIDETAYVVGPSIKDAATKSPALVVILASKERRRLQSFFDELWKKAR